MAPGAAATNSVTRGIAAVPADGSVATATDGSGDSVFAGTASADGHSGIGAGGVAGIVIALLVVAAILVGFLIRRRKQRKSRAVQESKSLRICLECQDACLKPYCLSSVRVP